MDELATNQPTRIVQKPFEALDCRLIERSCCNVEYTADIQLILADVIQDEIQITKLHRENFSPYSRFCRIFRPTVEELQRKAGSCPVMIRQLVSFKWPPSWEIKLRRRLETNHLFPI